MAKPYKALIRIARRLETMFGGTISNEDPLIRIAQALEGGSYDDTTLASITTSIADLEERVTELENSVATVTVTVKVDSVATEGVTVTATKGTVVRSAVSDENGEALLTVGAGTWTIEGTFDETAYYDITDASVTVVSGSEVTANITAKAILLDSIAITTQPTTTAYAEGDTVDPTGMVVTATYTDSSTAEVTDYTLSPTTIASDTTTITVSYTEGTITETATYSVTVS